MVNSDLRAVEPLLRRIGSISLQAPETRKIVSYRDLSPQVQERFARMMAALFRSEAVRPRLQNTHGTLRIGLKKDDSGHFVTIGGSDVQLLGDEAQKLFEALFGDAAAVEETRLDDFAQWIAQETAERREAAPKTESLKDQTKSMFVWLISLAADSIGVIRNTWSTQHGPAMSIAGLGVAGGSVGVVGGSIMTAKGVVQLQESRKIGDSEGFALASLYMAAGVNYIGVGTALAMIHGSTLHGPSAASVSAAAGQAINPLVVAMNLLLLAHSAYVMHLARTFRDELKESVEKQGVRGGIEFLHEQLSLTNEELAKLQGIEDRDQRKSELERILKLKHARFERRTDAETFKKVLDKIDGFDKAFRDGTANAETIRDAKSLLDIVMEANYKKMVKSAILIFLALAGIASVVVALTMSGGAPAIAFIVVSGLWIALDTFKGNDLIADQFWRIHQKLFNSKLLTTDMHKEIEGISKLMGARAQAISDGWMESLYRRDPSLKLASREVKDSAFKIAYSGTWDSYRSLAANLARTSSDTMEFLHLKRDSEFADLRDADAMLSKIRESCPDLADAFSREGRKEALCRLVEKGRFGWEAVLEAMHLPYARNTAICTALQFFDLADEICSSPSAEGLESQAGRIRYLKREMPLFWALIAEHATDAQVDEAILDAKTRFLAEQPSGNSLTESEQIKNAAIYFLRVHQQTIVKRDAVFGRFDEATIASVAQKGEPPVPLMQIGSALASEFPRISDETAYDRIASASLLLSGSQAEILKHDLEFRQRAGEKYPDFFAQFLRNPVISRTFDLELQIDLSSLQEIELGGQTLRIPVQTAKDLVRSPDTEIGEKGVSKRFIAPAGEGKKALLRLKEMAGDDEELFFSLASFMNQNAKNFSLYFMEELRDLELASGLYMPQTIPVKQTIEKMRDGSFEVSYVFQCSLISELDEKDRRPFEFSTLFRLERSAEGRWVGRNPRYLFPEEDPAKAGLPGMFKRSMERSGVSISSRI